MKKVCPIIAVALAICFTSLAQSPFQKGTNIINLGFGVGDFYWGSTYSNGSLPVSLNASYEHGITEKLGIGYIGLGGQISYATQKYVYNGQEEWSGSGMLLAARASYHFEIPGTTGQKLDPYAGILLGFVITSYSYDKGYSGGYYDGRSGSSAVGIYAGVHYHFNPRVAVYGELGFTTFSILNIGIAFGF